MDSSSSIWQHCLQYAARSDIGLRRANNQDALAVMPADSQASWRQRGHLFVVADGMGAHAAGELASKIACDVVPLSYLKLAVAPPLALQSAILDANAQIHARGQSDPEFKGMGTTCTALALLPEGAIVAHVGDSRAYRFRAGTIEQLTFDHSLLWELRQSGQVGEEALRNYVSKNIITRSLGPSPSVQIDLEGPFPIEVGDTYLLCSDGLSNQVNDEEIGAVLDCLPIDEAVESLVNLANLRGGPDNITVIAVRVTGPQQACAEEPTSGDRRSARRGEVHPLLWALIGALAAAAALLFILQHRLAAGIALVAAAVVAVFVLAERYGAAAAEEPMRRYRPLGRGPHVTNRAAPGAKFCATLVDLCNQLREAAANESWTIDWEELDRRMAQARQDADRGDHRAAGGGYLRVISFLMGQIRRQSQAASTADRQGHDRDGHGGGGDRGGYGGEEDNGPDDGGRSVLDV